jgi:hypothetical protein
MVKHKYDVQCLQGQLSVKEVEQLIKSPAMTHALPARRTSVLPSAYVQDVFRDKKPSKQGRSNVDIETCNAQQLLELCNVDKKGINFF